MNMRELENEINRRMAALRLSREDVADKMTQLCGRKVSRESVQHYFSGNSGVPLELIGPFLLALDLKTVPDDMPEITQRKLDAYKELAREHLNGDC